MAKRISKRVRELRPPWEQDPDRWRRACHEAGHAAIGCLVRQPFRYASLERTGRSGGHVLFQLSKVLQRQKFVERKDGTFTLRTVGPSFERRTEKLMFVCFGGRFGEIAVAGNSESSDLTASDDYDHAFDLAMRLFKDEDVAAEYHVFIQERLRDAFAFDPDLRWAVFHVADQLFREGRVSARTIRGIVRSRMRDGEGRYKEYLRPVRFLHRRTCEAVPAQR